MTSNFDWWAQDRWCCGRTSCRCPSCHWVHPRFFPTDRQGRGHHLGPSPTVGLHKWIHHMTWDASMVRYVWLPGFIKDQLAKNNYENRLFQYTKIAYKLWGVDTNRGFSLPCGTPESRPANPILTDVEISNVTNTGNVKRGMPNMHPTGKRW